MAKVEADLAPEGGGGGGRGGGGKAATGGVKVMLGGVGMHFHREIKPYEGFEVWTRVLCWDRKWVYLVGHFVRKGAVRPTTHILQPWRRGRERAGKGGGGEKEEEEEKGDGVFASGIAKYVFKHGRRTIPPERILRASELLPPAPTVGEEGSDIITTSTSTTPPTLATTAENLPLHPPSESAEDAITASLTTAAGEEGTEWTWERVEAERKRGLRIAETYNALDGLKSEFTGKRGMALGRY